jgi:FMN-dependent NADH-azoreductase
MKLLHIDSSILGGNSVSRQLSAAIVAELKAANAAIEVTYRDVATDVIPHTSGELLGAKAAGPESLSPEMAAAVSTTEASLEEFLASDIVVIGAPMYNFGIPSQLKTWIDTLGVAGRTFAYTANGVEGKCGGKRVIIASSRGGVYSEGPAMPFDHQETYLKAWFGFLGITDIEVIRAEGVAMGPDQRTAAIESATTVIKGLKA